jgi:two-component system OmpR family response regulator
MDWPSHDRPAAVGSPPSATEPDRAAHVLVVEDDVEISALLERFLRGVGYRVSVAHNSAEMDVRMAVEPVDLVLLDLLLPDEHGLSLCRRIRASSSAGIIMVTALSELTDVVVGLEVGADDYVTKPFELRELAARIGAVLRRGGGAKAEEMDGLGFAGWRFHPERRVLYSPAGVRVSLTGAEADLLLTFCQNPRRVLTRLQLIGLTRGAADLTNERTIDLLVSRLRRKLAGAGRQLELIRTMRHDGYMFQPDLAAR